MTRNARPYPPSSSATVPLPVSDTMLQAYVDGHLAPEQARQVEDWLALHPERAAQASDYDNINAALHTSFDPVLTEAVPERFTRLLSSPATPPRRLPWRDRLLNRLGPPWRANAARGGGWRFATMITAVAWMSVGAVLGWQARPVQPGDAVPPMVRHAAVAYATYATEENHPVEVGAGDAAHLEAWLSRRLGLDLRAARLDAAGYRLMGGRLLAGLQRPVAQFMYEDHIGRRLTLYVKTQESGHDQSIDFRFAQEGEINAFYWIENGTGYVLSGNLDRNELLKVAKMAFTQINAPAPPTHDAGRLQGSAIRA